MKFIHILFIAFVGFFIFSCGEVNDCSGVGLNIGDACNDGNPGTTNDIVNADCTCSGTLDTNFCQSLQLLIGASCDDGDITTQLDTVSTDCICQGFPYDCTDLSLNIGDACDDLIDSTGNDMITDDCLCKGRVYDCISIEKFIGNDCDDENINTEEDKIQNDCTCVGTVTYKSAIRLLINSTCGGNDNCHSSTPNFTFPMTNYEETVAAADSMRLGKSILIGAVNHQLGFDTMPRGNFKLEQEQIDLIQAWIDGGTPEGEE